MEEANSNIAETSFCVIEANPDISGTGIRASVYALCLAAGILKTIIARFTSHENYKEFVQALNSAMQLQGLALLYTAIYQTVKKQITLFHAICVLHLLSLLGFGLAAQRRYGHGLVRWLVLAGVRVVVAAAFVVLTAYIWVTAPTFGSQPDCNPSTIYVVFGISILATNNVFRYVILGLLIFMAVAWVFSMIIFAVLAYCCCGRRRMLKLSEHLSDFEVIKSVISRQTFADRSHRRNAAVSQILNSLVYTSINLYMVITLEETISRNHLSESEQEWTFG